MKRIQYNKYWEDKSNWKWGCFYCCKDDPRVIVPKKPAWMGRTLNFAHNRSYWCLLWTFSLALGPALLVDKMDEGTWKFMYLIIIVSLVIFYYVADLRAE